MKNAENFYLDHETCTSCGGHCCKTMPGTCSPDDVLRIGQSDNIETALAAVFKTKLYAIDWWEGDPRPKIEHGLSRTLYIRPRHVGHDALFDPSWGDVPCVFLVDGVGCKLPAAERPSNCRELEPGDPCVNHDGGKRGMAILWIPYQKQIEIVSESLEDRK